MLDLHLSVLDPYVDKFVILEANKTFSGKDKPLYFFRDERLFKQWWNKVSYFALDAWDDVPVWTQALNSPHTKGADHWKREFYIKEHLYHALKQAKVQDEDTVFIGDVDEIWDPSILKEKISDPLKLKLKVYTYYLNNRSSEEFWGTLVGKYGAIKGQVLNHLRAESPKSSDYKGWHFTSMGGLKEIERKLDDSYTIDSYNMNIIPGHVEACLRERRDFLNRPFTYQIDESEWPQYLKNNRAKYKNLLL